MNARLVVFVNIMLLIAGMLMDNSPIILIFTPILLPIMKTIGVNPIHFGMIMLINTTIGLVTPPVGTILFVGLGIANLTLEKVLKTVLIFLLPIIMVLTLVTYFEPVAMWLPKLFMK